MFAICWRYVGDMFARFTIYICYIYDIYIYTLCINKDFILYIVYIILYIVYTFVNKLILVLDYPF